MVTGATLSYGDFSERVLRRERAREIRRERENNMSRNHFFMNIMVKRAKYFERIT